MKTTGASYASGRQVPAVLTDFDDTAATQNVAELLLTRFGDPTWTSVRQQFRDGELDLKEYQEITFRNIRADQATMQAYVKEHASLRPYFRELWGFCKKNAFPMAVVSQGLDFYISALLQKGGFDDIPIYAVNTKFTAGTISYEYKHAYPGQESKGNSKGFIVDGFQQRGHYVVYAGDGLSDLEAARKADLVFAHRNLARYCDEENIPYSPFENFKGMLLAVREFSRNGSHPDYPVPGNKGQVEGS
mgnify:FL=1